MRFQTLLNVSRLEIWKGSRSENSILLLPQGNYSLPADKLQVCCLSLPAYNRWGWHAFWQDAILLVAALAKCMLPFKHAGEVCLLKLRPQHFPNLLFLFASWKWTCAKQHNAPWKTPSPPFFLCIFSGEKFDTCGRVIYLDDHRRSDKLRTRLTLDWRRGVVREGGRARCMNVLQGGLDQSFITALCSHP